MNFITVGWQKVFSLEFLFSENIKMTKKPSKRLRIAKNGLGHNKVVSIAQWVIFNEKLNFKPIGVHKILKNSKTDQMAIIDNATYEGQEGCPHSFALPLNYLLRHKNNRGS